MSAAEARGENGATLSSGDSKGAGRYLEQDAAPQDPLEVHLARYLDGVKHGKYEFTSFFRKRYPDAEKHGAGVLTREVTE